MSSEVLLPFHHTILEAIHDPSASDFVLLARGLGLRKIVCTLMKIYDSPQSLILLVNASPEEEAAIGEELGIMGCRKPGLRVVDYEMPKRDRCDLYKKGGLISVTSRILIVDILLSDIPTELITGILVLHAEKVTALSPEAFIVRLYREKNTVGFLKAFSDQPEHITSGLSPLKNVLKELQVRNVHIYPRFHQDVQSSLERRRADVVELHQPMTPAMQEIHTAVVDCMTATLGELKRSNTSLELDDLTVENAYFRSFDAVVRRQLDPVWHKVGPRTKQLVSDLAMLRRLLLYLLTYDALAFHEYLETIVLSNSVSAAGNQRQHQSPWLLTDASHIIFTRAKRRCYEMTAEPVSKEPEVIDLADDDDAWSALDEVEQPNLSSKKQVAKDSKVPRKPRWLPNNIKPVLEELPKWELLTETLKEIEEEIIRQESLSSDLISAAKGTNTVLVMTSSLREANMLSEYLTKMDADAPAGQKGRGMMMEKLGMYLWWKTRLAKDTTTGRPTVPIPDALRNSHATVQDEEDGLSEALKKKDKDRHEKSANRRRVRGGAHSTAESTRGKGKSADIVMTLGEEAMRDEAENIAHLFEIALAMTTSTADAESAFLSDFNQFYGLLPPQMTVLVRAYSDDSDDRLLAEIQPRFIIMYEPNQDFIRRIEVYKSSNAGLPVRVYFMLYSSSSEEHKYLAGIRKEKDAFEKLIKERGSMLMPIYEDRHAEHGPSDALIKTISTRIAGGRKEVSTEQSRIIVDMREFRSALPSLLHASKLCIIPATLTVGDYILTPDIAVERKSIPDLVQSFNSGRLYSQCELMSAHYKQPILLIEFEEHKSFSLEIIQDIKSYAKPAGKYPPKKGGASNGSGDTSGPPTVQQKLVLLTLSFPRVRIIWSSSPYATADIFNDLKTNQFEPDYKVAVAIGAEEDPDAGAGVNSAAEELLRTIPGITAKNAKYVMSRVPSVRALCDLSLPEVQDVLGSEPGKTCWEFLHWGERQG
ncbi:hypothetical protein K488DRAFT_56035 [Vararia minispora EC-137]|uniref:Uncharacterized protein n=1 Tax=Vararia minispora EC-137 TaxID=1314806 RepID=A0ACB8QD17_9AGAM|nr:hypothetical protein K488DRAFT_56035 [Vararia minispora EC-137]